MMIFMLVIHVIVCILLLVIVLIQSGRGGGLVEGVAGVESILGTKTSAFLTKSTTVLSTMFFITCLTLAFLSAQQGKSLIRDNLKVDKKQAAAATDTKNTALPVAQTAPKDANAQENPKTQ
ncbi:MAG: preprotein translocase subunit SecG [Candidatus Omnitrophica bacterium]|jgi:preprotein translocase subunit SecG|nr:preprotein translocase subunit SecG [Candidatus Omnitrophota bacterium]